MFNQDFKEWLLQNWSNLNAQSPAEREKLVYNIEEGCSYCKDFKSKKEREIFFFDYANNMKLCKYCPICGRKLED